MLASNRKSSLYPGHLFYLAFFLIMKFIHLFTLSAQIMYKETWVPYSERLPAVLSTGLLNFDSLALHIVIYLIAGPLLMSLEFFPEVTEPNYREYRQTEIVRLGFWSAVCRRTWFVFVQVFFTVFLVHCIDYLLSLIIAPQNSLGFFRWAGNHFVSNPMRLHQLNWGNLPYSVDCFYFLFSLQASLTQAILLATVVILSYWRKIDYRLLLFMPFILLLVLEAITMLLSTVTGLGIIREVAPSFLISFFAGSGRNGLPLQWPFFFHVLIFLVFYLYSRVQLPKRGYLP